MKKFFRITSATSIVGIALVLAIGFVTQNYAYAANTLTGNNTLVSVNNVDGQGLNGYAFPRGLSSVGNIALYLSYASNLPGAVTYSTGAYLRNMKLGTTQKLDVSTSGISGNGSVYSAVLSETGRYAAFVSRATNLIDGVVQRPGQTYIHDSQTGTTTLASVFGQATYGFGRDSTLNNEWDVVTGISNDGRFITLETRSPTLSTGPTRPYVVGYGDMSTHTWTAINNPQLQEAAWATGSSMSCDGSFIVFSSSQSNLPSIGIVGNNRIFVADVRNSNIPVISVISGYASHSPKISCNGNFIAYSVQNQTTDPTPIPSGMNSKTHLVHYNRLTGERSYVDSNSTGTQFDTNQTNVVQSSTIRHTNYFIPSIADSGDITFRFRNQFGQEGIYLKHLSDGSGTLENVRKKSNGTYIIGFPGDLNFISANGKYIIYGAPAYELGLITSSTTENDVIRTETGL